MKSIQPVIKHLDAPIRFLTIPVKDVVIYLAPFLVGGLFDSYCIVPGVCIIIILTARKIIKKYPRRLFVRWVYWKIPIKHFNKAFRINYPPPNKRLFVR